ncbi:hypothetical protein HPB48_022235 [Haemaphysalis longicornis]|uniref:Uncharacterized protein n=1 Tax=Haemaphysalis longicornis TaxID=44386 RepID=A0A9J6FXX4_HAELO|nr:hypothetical protein HPB48_022235 [Haemaphysalis longicornis]
MYEQLDVTEVCRPVSPGRTNGPSERQGQRFSPRYRDALRSHDFLWQHQRAVQFIQILLPESELLFEDRAFNVLDIDKAMARRYGKSSISLLRLIRYSK